MAIATGLLGFNDLGHSFDPYFSFQRHVLFTIISTLSKMNKKSIIIINLYLYTKSYHFTWSS